MVLHGADLQAYDIQGKSVSDHCYTCEIHYALRDLGAPLSLNEQTCGMGVIGILGVTTIIVGKIILTACYKTCFPQ